MKRTMLSAAKIKEIRSLREKKFRDGLGLFCVEGEKMVAEALASGLEVVEVYRKEDIGEKAMERISALSSPSPVLAVVRMPSPVKPAVGGLCLALDGIRDPGNMGTILRTADWFGITDIVCSPDTADVYNPKVVQATMGSIARVRVHYTDLPRFLRSIPKEIPIYGTLLDGDDIYSNPLTHNGIIVMGNEGNGLSQEVRQLLTHRLLIPSFAAPSAAGHAESLNVSIATAVILSEFRGRVKKT